jgi:hypothetical protein
MRPGRTAAAASAAALALPLSGCSTVHEQAVMTTVSHFYAALRARNGRGACALLAPGTRSELEQSADKPCDRAILEEGVPHPGVRRGLDVFGTMAQVRFSHDTVFVARFNDGWRVTATACKAVPGEPYSCSVKGA